MSRRSCAFRAKDWIWSGKAENASESSSVVVWRGFSSLFLRSRESDEFLKTCLPVKSCLDLRRSRTRSMKYFCKINGTSVEWSFHRGKAVNWYLDGRCQGSTAVKWKFEFRVVSNSISSSEPFLLSVFRNDEGPWFFYWISSSSIDLTVEPWMEAELEKCCLSGWPMNAS